MAAKTGNKVQTSPVMAALVHLPAAISSPVLHFWRSYHKSPNVHRTYSVRVCQIQNCKMIMVCDPLSENESSAFSTASEHAHWTKMRLVSGKYRGLLASVANTASTLQQRTVQQAQAVIFYVLTILCQNSFIQQHGPFYPAAPAHWTLPACYAHGHRVT